MSDLNIELEITLRCNAICKQCSRHCNIFNYNETDMSIEQVHKFVEEVKSNNMSIGVISIMGGEPTLHPDFSKITKYIYDELYGKNVRFMRIATNGINLIPDDIRRLPIKIITSNPKSKSHRCQFIAPKDSNQLTKDFCDIPKKCGIALNCFGYFPCGAGGAIARLFGTKKFFKYELPKSYKDFGDIREVCYLCQAFATKPKMEKLEDSTPSISFLNAIERYHKEKPRYKLF